MTVTDTSDRLNEPRASQWIFSASPSDQTCARAQKWTSTEHKQWPPKGSCSTNVMQKDPSFFVWGDFSWSSKWRNIDWTCFWCFCCFFYSWNLYNDDFQKESPLPGNARIDFHLVFWVHIGLRFSRLSVCLSQQIFGWQWTCVHHWSTQWASLLMLLLKDRLQDSTMTLWHYETTNQSSIYPFNQSANQSINQPRKQKTI